MKIIYLTSLIMICAAAFAGQPAGVAQGSKTPCIATLEACFGQKQPSKAEFEQLADAIYKIEGGSKTRYPYGIMSVKTSDPRRVCINTCRNTYQRWLKAGRPGCYLNFLADRYCPPSADPTGNKNWKKNVHAVLKVK